ncbi:response regulator transcription factor [Pedobacter suwonensis]|uniref:response regulator transcription factor n=1 Tax=Pedobacter suwonensis TaxID=332999 RepID=UPI0025D6038F|nr:response regulator [uncultured Pedobacter sp.]
MVILIHMGTMMKKKIMVLEDDRDIREIIGLLLDEENYEVKLYPDIRSFRKDLLFTDPSLVILDVRLPDGSGHDLCREVKNDQRTLGVPVLMMSAHCSVAEVNRKCYPDDFIAKPFSIDDFVARVNAVVN